MAKLIRVDVDAMETAAARCDALAEEIDRCKQECLALNNQLQDCYEGQSAVAFDEFCRDKATPILQEVSDMCCKTAQGIRHTCSQFTEADGTLSGTFRV